MGTHTRPIFNRMDEAKARYNRRNEEGHSYWRKLEGLTKLNVEEKEAVVQPAPVVQPYVGSRKTPVIICGRPTVEHVEYTRPDAVLRNGPAIVHGSCRGNQFSRREFTAVNPGKSPPHTLALSTTGTPIRAPGSGARLSFADHAPTEKTQLELAVKASILDAKPSASKLEFSTADDRNGSQSSGDSRRALTPESGYGMPYSELSRAELSESNKERRMYDNHLCYFSSGCESPSLPKDPDHGRPFPMCRKKASLNLVPPPRMNHPAAGAAAKDKQFEREKPRYFTEVQHNQPGESYSPWDDKIMVRGRWYYCAGHPSAPRLPTLDNSDIVSAEGRMYYRLRASSGTSSVGKSPNDYDCLYEQYEDKIQDLQQQLRDARKDIKEERESNLAQVKQADGLVRTLLALREEIKLLKDQLVGEPMAELPRNAMYGSGQLLYRSQMTAYQAATMPMHHPQRQQSQMQPRSLGSNGHHGFPKYLPLSFSRSYEVLRLRSRSGVS
ncbi:hypothetical protein BJ170DRAFT_46481 [Xylariales sp. AK1849]|nr:hypothetical protein BJ170DRAFT_46481 [Xylariales sp. AK1849]